MIRTFKTFGLAMVAVLAMSAFVASAQAAQYTASSYPRPFTGSSELGNSVLTTEAGKVECKGHYQGTLSAASSTVTVTPTYTECKAFGFLSATVSMNGCTYVFHLVSLTSANGALQCPAGKVVTLVAGNCETTFGAQGPLSAIAMSNGPSVIDAKANVTGISYTVTKDGIVCPYAGTGAKTGATLTTGQAVRVAPTPVTDSLQTS